VTLKTHVNNYLVVDINGTILKLNTIKLNYLTAETTKPLFLKLLNILKECSKSKIKSCTLQTETNAIRFQGVKDTEIFGLPLSIVVLESFTVSTTQFSQYNKPT